MTPEIGSGPETVQQLASGIGMCAVDLSFPIDPNHFRWRHERTVVDRLTDGGPFETSRFTMSAHAFTHADAPSHVSPDGGGLDEVALTTWVGRAIVADISGVSEASPISAAILRESCSRVSHEDILLLRTDWDRRRDISSREYWADAPWISKDAADWLAERRPRAVGFDFPQDAAIRGTLDGERGRPADFVTHDRLLRHGIGLIEYLRGLDRLPDEVLLVAAPIALTGSDGGPIRAIAFPAGDLTKNLHTTRTEGES